MKKGLSFLAVAAFAAAITLTGSIPAFARDSYDAPSGYDTLFALADGVGLFSE